jgi:hypothetical protein
MMMRLLRICHGHSLSVHNNHVKILPSRRHTLAAPDVFPSPNGMTKSLGVIPTTPFVLTVTTPPHLASRFSKTEYISIRICDMFKLHLLILNEHKNGFTKIGTKSRLQNSDVKIHQKVLK